MPMLIKIVYQLKIVLQGVRPQIWRRVQVPADIALDELHLVLQAAMGWTNSHLHSFTFGEHRYTMPYEPGDLEELQMEDECEMCLSELITQPKQTFGYDYDFGDNWEHLVTLEKILPAAPAVKYPLCFTGKRACPPEDCGGIWGMQICSKSCTIPRMRNTRKCELGPGANSTRKCSMSRGSAKT